MAMSPLQKLKQLDDERSKILAGAKQEALEGANDAVAALNALGFSYRLVEGALTALLGLILVKIATDLRYAREVPSLSGTHLLNALDSWQDFCKTLIGLAVVAFLAAALRFAS